MENENLSLFENELDKTSIYPKQDNFENDAQPRKVFENKHKFQDDIWKQITLNDLERDVIDTPEFQRLFRTSQLGFVDLVYQTANHSRGAHSIGACYVADFLMKRLEENMGRRSDLTNSLKISTTDRILIRLGALLHDITHVPLSHDLERKTHKIFFKDNKNGNIQNTLKTKSSYGFYEKHDDIENNPLLYILLHDKNKSVLARVLSHYSKHFYSLLLSDAQEKQLSHLEKFANLLEKVNREEWNPEEKLLPDLLFHLLTYEQPDKWKKTIRYIAIEFNEKDEVIREDWGLGPKNMREELHRSWYQPFRHDIIGNTLSADLIDYLTRDPNRMGMNRHIDLHLLNYYVLVPYETETNNQGKGEKKGNNARHSENTKLYRCAIDLYDHKRGTIRIELLNDIFRLLDLRHEIHEKAVMHRVVLSANAMLSRALLLMGDNRPKLNELIRLNENQYHALQSEDTFFEHLLEKCDPTKNKNSRNSSETYRILTKLIDRRVYRPLIIIPGDRANKEFKFQDISSEQNLRSLATIIDSKYYQSFFLFITACMEKYLEGVFDDFKDFCNFIKNLIDGDDSSGNIKLAMNLLPSRIIIWTTPYKQLYKDPAVVVALGGNCTDPIDVLLTQKEKHILDNNQVAFERIEKSINNSDSQYSALWKIYVFISDGLFYTGILNKLKDSISKKTTSEKDPLKIHKQKLIDCQALFVMAMDAVSDDWFDSIRRVNSDDLVEALKRKLESKMIEPSRFKSLIARWLVKYLYSDKPDLTDEIKRTYNISTVDVNHYVHHYPLNEEVGRQCRDIRYKMDVSCSPTLDEAIKDTTSNESKLVKFLEQIGIYNHKVISDLEFKDLVKLYTQAENIIQPLMNISPKDRPSNLDILKVLWLSGFPYSDRVLPQKEGEKKEISEIPADVLSSIHSIRKWLLEESKILDYRVRKRLTINIGDIVSFIEAKPTEIRPKILEDLHQRFLNESTLIFNDIKADQIINFLKSKWS